MNIYPNIQQEYELTGMVSQSFELTNTQIIPALRKDGLLFQQAIQKLREDGHFRVPYIFTEAIADVAYDKTLVSVIQEILGENTPWVVWGANIQQGTPNEAEKWHVDIESWHWSTITVMVGLKNCNDHNATRCIPYSHKLNFLPWSVADSHDDECVQKAAQSLDSRCSSIDTFKNFQPGSFYVLNAKSWHCGPALSKFHDREMLILHYQRADDPRIPYMYDYEKRLWFDRAAVYLEQPDSNKQLAPTVVGSMSSMETKRFRTDLYPLPSGHGLCRGGDIEEIYSKAIGNKLDQDMSNKPLVSIVIICFNGEKFLPEAIASVIDQTYDNWELFLVDDGSTDNSPGIMQDYVAQYSEKIRYLEHKNHQNRGQNASRNLGIKHAKGEYIALLDSDDVWLSHKLEQQVAILEQYSEAGMVYGRIYDWYGWTGKPEDRQSDGAHKFPLGVEPNRLVVPPTLLVPLLKGDTQVPQPSNPLYRRQVFEKVGLFNENFRDIFEDQDFYAKVFHHIPIFVSNILWSKYRQHPDSLMANYNSAMKQNINIWYEKRLYFLKSVKKYLSRQKVKYPEVWNCLNDYIADFQKKQKQQKQREFHSKSTIKTLKSLWLQLLDLIMLIGRRVLPFALRDWLWKKIGYYLYS